MIWKHIPAPIKMPVIMSMPITSCEYEVHSMSTVRLAPLQHMMDHVIRGTVCRQYSTTRSKATDLHFYEVEGQ